MVELGTGLSSRYERLNNSTCHWYDLDLTGVIELRRRFFTDTEQRRMIAASVLDTAWPDIVAQAHALYPHGNRDEVHC